MRIDPSLSLATPSFPARARDNCRQLPEAWCILRMAGPRTLPLVRSLAKAGFTVWAPQAMRRQFRPRSTKYRDSEVAVLPAFAFARHEDVDLLNAIAMDPISDHPAFTILKHNDYFAKVADTELQPLREYEAKLASDWSAYLKLEDEAQRERARRKKSKRRKTPVNRRSAYVLGQRVSVTCSAFTGLTATVTESRRNGELVIVFDSSAQEWTMDSCDLSPIHLDTAKPERAQAA